MNETYQRKNYPYISETKKILIMMYGITTFEYFSKEIYLDLLFSCNFISIQISYSDFLLHVMCVLAFFIVY